MLRVSRRALLASVATWLTAPSRLVLGEEPVQLTVGVCSAFYAGWGTQDGMSFYLALEYWRNGPQSLGGGFEKPAEGLSTNITVRHIDSGCSSQTSFENTMTVFGSGPRPDVIVGCICSGGSLSVGRFSTTFEVPMIATTSQSSKLSDKTEYPYLFRMCATELSDADVHAGVLETLGAKTVTIVYVDSERGVKQKDKLVQSGVVQAMDSILTVRLEDIDMVQASNYERNKLLLRKVRSSSSWVLVMYLASSSTDKNENMVGQAALDLGLLNNHSVVLFAETMGEKLKWGQEKQMPLWVLAHLAGSMYQQAKPVAAAYEAWMIWRKTVNPDTLKVLGWAGVGMEDEMLTEAKSAQPWHAFRFEATFLVLLAARALKKSGSAITGTTLKEKILETPLHGLMGDVSWDVDLNRQGLVYDIFQLQITDAGDSQPTRLVNVGEMVLEPGARATLSHGKLRFSSGPQLSHLVAPPCGDGFKPDPFSSPSECMPCPSGSYSSTNVEGCTPCTPGNYAPHEGLSSCLRCPVGSYNDTYGAESCSMCMPGLVSAVDGSSCQACDAGFSQASRGASKCQRCPMGRFQASTGQSECNDCARILEGGVTQLLGAFSKDDCVCPENTFYIDAKKTCDPCPEGLVCHVGRGQPRQKGGFYAKVPSIEGQAPVVVVRCESTTRCPNDMQLGSCPPHRVGLACNVCEGGFAEGDDGECNNCDDQSTEGPFTLTIVVAICALIGLFIFSTRELKVYNQTRATIAITFGLSVTALQAIGTFRELSVEWVEPIKTLTTVLQILTFQVEYLRLDCVFHMNDPVATFASSVLMYPVFATALTLAFLLTFLLGTLADSRGQRKGFVLMALGRQTDKYQIMNVHGLILLVALLSLTIATLLPWQCIDNPDGTQSVASYRDVLCFETGDHAAMLALSSVSFIIIVLGFISVVSWATFIYPSRIAKPGGIDFVKQFHFLFHRFTPACYYYSLVYIFRNLFLGILPILFVNVAVLQVMLLLLLIASTGMLQMWLQPWRTGLANAMDAVFSLALILILGGGAMLLDIDPDQGQQVLQGLLIVVVILVLVIVIVILGYAAFTTLNPQKRYGVFLCHHKGGAAVLARWFKLMFSERVSARIFLDSDELDRLDLIFYTVAYETENLVILLTAETLRRMWCGGEIASAVFGDIRVVPVACDDYVAPADSFLTNDLPNLWSDRQQSELAQLGVKITQIDQAYRALREIKSICFQREGSMTAQEETFGKVAAACAFRSGASQIARSMSSIASFGGSAGEGTSDAQIVILGDQADVEAKCVCQVVQRYLQRQLQVAVAIRMEKSEMKQGAGATPYLVAVLTRGALASPHFAEALVEALDSGVFELVPLQADQAFAYPDPKFWTQLENGQVLAPKSVQSVTDVMAAYRAVFGVLALTFSAHGSLQIQLAETTEMAPRFRAFRGGPHQTTAVVRTSRIMSTAAAASTNEQGDLEDAFSF